MAKFKRLSRFLQRIGIKKKKQRQNDSVDLARRSWSSRLLKMLKIKSRRSRRDGGDHGDHDDAAEVDSISDSPKCSGVNTVEGFHWEPPHSNFITSASCSSSDLTSVTELSNHQLHEGEISLVSSELSSITSTEEVLDVKSNVSAQLEDAVYQSAEPACIAIQPVHDDKELFVDKDEQPQSNTIDDDDNIVLLTDWLPVLVIVLIIIINTVLVSSVFILFIYLLYLM